METTPKQIAEQAWKNRLENLSKNGLAQVEGCNLSLWNVPDNSEEREYWKQTFKSGAELGIFDYKEALREDVQKRINAYPDFQQRNMAQDSAVATLKELLELIETVTPKE